MTSSGVDDSDRAEAEVLSELTLVDLLEEEEEELVGVVEVVASSATELRRTSWRILVFVGTGEHECC